MKKITKLKNASNLSDLAKILGYPPKSVSYILYIIPDSDKYTFFSLPKKDGGVRKILAPRVELRNLQSCLSRLLYDCYEELFGINPSNSVSHGFSKGHSIITHSRKHKNKRYVFNLDLKDFFPSITFGRVRKFFIKDSAFQLNPKVATVIAQIACHDNQLPQGSPLSPVISNYIGRILDVRLVRLAKKAKCSYSRYADDITFSTRAKDFPELIAELDSSEEWRPSTELEAAIKNAWFSVNYDKISMQYMDNRQMVTGLVVNRKVNIRSDYYRQARSMCNALFRDGYFYVGKEMRWGKTKDDPTPKIGTLSQLRGVLSHIYNVKKHHDERDIKEKWENPTAIHNLYRRFMYFEKFHALQKPLILCEGETDIVYIKCAIRSLHLLYPKLVSCDVAKKKTEFFIDFFKYSQRNMDIMQFSGGSGDLAAFISKYERSIKPFLCDGRKFPIIILVDNDSGAKPVFQAASKKIGGIVDGSKDYYHLDFNLYLVALPKAAGGSDVAIENLFEPHVIGKVLDGKTFNPDQKTFNPAIHYGKLVFAEKIVKADQKTIKFDCFKPVLARLESAIADYTGVLSRL